MKPISGIKLTNTNNQIQKHIRKETFAGEKPKAHRICSPMWKGSASI
jgi:hypothetical protein